MGGRRLLAFGAAEPLVALMQETPLDRLIPVLVEKLRAGTDLRALVEAGPRWPTPAPSAARTTSASTL